MTALRPFWPHQRKAFAYTLRTRRPALVMEMRTGKSPVTVRRCKLYKPLSPETGLRILVICPSSAIGGWEETLTAENCTYKVLEGTKKKRKKILDAWDTNWFVSNKEIWISLPEIADKPWDSVILDECFGAGTLVATPNGQKAIEDFAVGDKIVNAFGESTVTAVRKSKHNTIVQVSAGAKIFYCSTNHPFFTERGWVYAHALRQNDRLYQQNEILRILRPNFYDEQTSYAFLRDILLGEVAHEAACGAYQGFYTRGSKEINSRHSKVLEKQSTSGKTSFAYEQIATQTELYVRPKNTKQGKPDFDKNRAYIQEARGKWNRDDLGAAISIQSAWKKMETGICAEDKAYRGERETITIFDRPCATENQTCGRSRRSNAQAPQSETTGQTKRQISAFTRVDSVKILERGDFEFDKLSQGKNFVNMYDLEVKNHPSFYVNDCLVHNSHIIKNPKAKITKWLLKNFRDVPARWMLTGSPAPENIMEWWTQLAWLDGAAFGFKNFWNFREKMFYVQGYDWFPKPGTLDYMQKYIGERCLIMSRKDAGITTHKEYQVRWLDMPAETRKLYDKAENEFAFGDDLTTVWATTRYQWLRQICSNQCGKLEELKYLLETELKGTKACIWFHYNESLKAVRDFLGDKCEYVWGAQKRAERDARRKRWAESKTCNLFLVQQAVAQMGMNLSASDTIIYYEETPSALATIQGEDRIVHLSKNTTLLYVYLVVKNSVDSDLHQILKAKRWTSDLSLKRACMKAAQDRAKGTIKGRMT